MRLCFSTLTCPNWSFPQIVGAAAAYGLHGIDLRGIGPEIDITKLALFDAELRATLELLWRHGLQLPCMNTSIALVTPAPERWEMMLDECHRYARLAERTGSRFLRIFGGTVLKGMTRGEATAMAQRHLRQLEKICSRHRCQVLLETHDAWATSEQVLELLDGMSPQEVGALWDIEHPCRRGETPHQTAKALRNYIMHVHLKDSIQRGPKTLPRLLGQGDLPVKHVIEALRAIGYDQWICLETEKRWHPQAAPEPEQSLPQFVHYVREHWSGHGTAVSGQSR
ncbi:MAG: sugar phosphate isomerase/epimerase [Planctomycetota bacterium]|nr:sugar phosphate isomerase/epimerase [Planctomycetota bacterium]